MSIAETIVATLLNAGEPMDFDAIAAETGLKRRQAADGVRYLMTYGLVERLGSLRSPRFRLKDRVVAAQAIEPVQRTPLLTAQERRAAGRALRLCRRP